jgi:dihydroflavonol-4-reductase
MIVKRLLEGSVRGLPDIGFGVVDVRDVADLHLRALNAPGMAGERFLCSGPFMKVAEIAAVLRSRLGPEASRVPTRGVPDFVVRIAALFDPQLRMVVGELGSVRNMDASHAKAVLGWVARPAEDSIVDTARSLLDQGIVRR